MQTYKLVLQSEVSKSFRSQKAANSLDIDTEKKSRHEFSVTADLKSPFKIGLIIGASGSGKTTLAKEIFGAKCFDIAVDPAKAVIDQFDASMSYDECADALLGIGLTSVPCWIKPMKALSNGQRARAEAAIALCTKDTAAPIVLDEWTSVVDRTVAKVMSHCVRKFAAKSDRQIILLSCHYDVLEWLDPDWVIDCNQQRFTDRRLLQPGERERREKLNFEIRAIDRSSWAYFSKYHYLSDSLAGGFQQFFGLFEGDNQVGFLVFSNYVPRRKGHPMILHSNRLVIHPDYAGIGLGLKFVDSCAAMLRPKGFRVMAKFSSVPMYKARLKSPKWRLIGQSKVIGRNKVAIMGEVRDTVRTNVQTFTFEYVYSEMSSGAESRISKQRGVETNAR